jgi:glycosyltransferase involved in cell wall biosynthesis
MTCIGDRLPSVNLGSGLTLHYVPWAGYEEYARFLRQSDIGLSLMLSPHTSYPPLEMAACGMTVVTTAYSTKTATELVKLSTNIVAVPPTVETLTDAIIGAVRRSEDLPARLAGSAVNLPATWDIALGPLIPKIMWMIDACRRNTSNTSGSAFGQREAA